MEKPRKGTHSGRVLVDSDNFKLAVAKDYIDGNYSLLQVGQKYNLPKDTIHYFVRWYKKRFPIVQLEAPVMNEDLSSHEELVKELAMARLKLTAMEMMISNYEKETGVDLIKKSGTKQRVK